LNRYGQKEGKGTTFALDSEREAHWVKNDCLSPQNSTATIKKGEDETGAYILGHLQLSAAPLIIKVYQNQTFYNSLFPRMDLKRVHY